MRSVRVAWALVMLAASGAVATAALYLSGDVHPLTDVAAVDGFPVTAVGALGGALVGAIVLSRYPRHRVGWLLCAGQAGTAVGLAADAYVFRFGSLPAATVARIFGAGWALAATFAVFLLVPDGRLLSRRWRPVPVLLVAAYVANLVPADPVRLAGVFAMAVVAVAAAAALVVRLRRSTGPRHRQLRWIVFSAVLLVAGLLLFVTVGATTAQPPAYLLYPFYLGFAAVPVCTGIAILRYRLYDIDVIIGRAFVLAVLAGLVTIGYVAVVVVVAALLGTGVNRGVWPSLAALVVVALAVQPLRHRVLRLADRVVYGRRAAPYEALADFSRRLGHTLAAQDLLPTMAEAVSRAVGASSVMISADLPAVSATWPHAVDRAPDLAVEVRDRTGALGRISLLMPPGRRLRPAERRLIDEFATQAALALRNVRLDAELRAQVDAAARQTALLESSRRRLLAARDEERRRTAAVIDREVLRHLREVPDAVAALDLTDRVAADEVLHRAEEAAARALDALREVTSGVYPALLTQRGLAVALRGHAGRGDHTGVLTVAPGLENVRFGERCESAAYFCAVALLPAADAMTVSIADGRLILEASIPPGRADAVVDRIEAAGGTVFDHAGTVRVELPTQPPAASAQTEASRSVPNEDFTR